MHPDARAGILVFEKRMDARCLFLGCRRTTNGGNWDRNLHRKDKTLSETSAVCERHFEEHFKEVKIPRGKPALTDDAVATLLPDLPAYLSKETRQRRPERKRVVVCPAACTKKLRLSRHDVLDSSLPGVSADGNDSLDVIVPQHDLHTIVNSVSVPNGWV